jgi:hypothetical protein
MSDKPEPDCCQVQPYIKEMAKITQDQQQITKPLTKDTHETRQQLTMNEKLRGFQKEETERMKKARNQNRVADGKKGRPHGSKGKARRELWCRCVSGF